MMVRELIVELQKQDPEARVLATPSGGDPEFFDVDAVVLGSELTGHVQESVPDRVANVAVLFVSYGPVHG